MAVKIKCMNEKCNNYKQELVEGTETCSLCSEPVTKFEDNVNTKLMGLSIAAAIAGCILFIFGFGLVWYVSFAVVPGSIVLAILSKSKAAIAVSILSLLVSALMFFVFFGGL